MTDPLDTTDPNAAPDANGAQLLLALVSCACVLICAFAWRDARLAKPRPMPYPDDVPATPQALASWRALPPEKQLARVTVGAFATMADVSCETLEPARVQLEYASASGSAVTTTFPAIRPRRLHVLTLESLTAGTDYNFQLTAIEADTGVPRVTRRGSFHTQKTDEPGLAPAVTSY